MKGGGMFDIDGFLNFRPAQEGEAREKEKREEHHLSLLPLSTAPAPEKISPV